MATQRIQKGTLAIDKILFDFIENEALPLAKLDSDTYWRNFEQVVQDLTPKKQSPACPSWWISSPNWQLA